MNQGADLMKIPGNTDTHVLWVLLWHLAVEAMWMPIRGIERYHVVVGPVNSGQQPETMKEMHI